MRTILLPVIAGCLFVACGQGGRQQQRNDTDSVAIVIPNLNTTPYFYVKLKGTIGAQPVTMQLMKSGPWMFRGYYTYDSIGEPISIWGSPDSSIGKVVIYESIEQQEERFFTGLLDSAGNFKGTWRGNGTSYPFSLQADLHDAVPLDVYYAADSVKLIADDPASPTGEASNSIVWPRAEASSAASGLIRKSITGSASVTDASQFIKKDIDSFLAAYKIGAADFKQTDIKEGNTASWTWAADADMKVVWNQYPLLVLESYSYEFTGGAHGNYGAMYQVLDFEKKKILTPEDIFKPGYKTALVPELEKAFRKKYNVEEGASIQDMLLEKQITPNNNFFLTDKGVAFSYTPYEIGPYVLGQITLFVPFRDISPLLR